MTASQPPLTTSAETNTADLFRLAMRRLAATVCVISSVDQAGQPHAMTATSVTSLSMEPASLLACINRWASLHESINESGKFCINILSGAQQQIADQCSRPNKLDNGNLLKSPWQKGYNQLPYLAESQAAVFCSLERAIEYTTHSIFIGLVDAVEVNNPVSPLIYVDGNYQHLLAVDKAAEGEK